MSCVAMGLFSGCTETARQQTVQETPQAVSVVELEPQRFVISTELPGRVSALEISEVRPQVGGLY